MLCLLAVPRNLDVLLQEKDLVEPVPSLDRRFLPPEAVSLRRVMPPDALMPCPWGVSMAEDGAISHHMYQLNPALRFLVFRPESRPGNLVE